MRGNDLLNKMELIDPEYIESASQTKRVHAVKRKTALLIAAVLLVLLATGSAWFISTLSVEVEQLTNGDFSYVIEIPQTQNYDELLRVMRESGMFTDEQISQNEKYFSAMEYKNTRLPQLAQEYDFDYKHLGLYYFDEVNGHFTEVGSMYNDTEALVFLHTDNEELKSETVVCIILYNPETSESKWEKVIIPHTGAYATTIDVLDGWYIENVYVMFNSEVMFTAGAGDEESWHPSGEPNYPDRDTHITVDEWNTIWKEFYADAEISAINEYWMPIYSGK